VPRDATATRTRLLREATRVFAEQGVYRAKLREITQAAGQRNASALTYHFGSREGVLWAILEAHNGPVDRLRAARLTDPVETMETRDLLGALLVPYATELATPDGRNYLRVVAQLTALFPGWRNGPLSPPALQKILDALERRAGGDPAARRERVVHAMVLLTSAMAERARTRDVATIPDFEDDRFLANLADMISGALRAPPGPVLDRSDVARTG
jgi:AcrR family transcriptional regulator